MKKVIAVTAFLFVMMASSAFGQTQDWVRQEKKNRWGEVEGYTYTQTIHIATANDKGKNTTVAVIFVYDPSTPNLFGIGSKTHGSLDVHPAFNFITTSITVTLRNKAGKEFTFAGIVNASSDFTTAVMGTQDADLIKLLKTNEEWDILIEGRNWYIRTKIKGNLP